MSYQWLTLWRYADTFLEAAWLTLQVTLLAFALAVALGLLSALAKSSPLAPLRWISHCYVEFIRNTPVLLQIFIIFFGLPSLGITMSAFTAGVLALGINVGAYLSETFRAGIQSVPKGQLEAAWVLGIPRRQIFLNVVLPQAARAVWPAIINNRTDRHRDGDQCAYAALYPNVQRGRAGVFSAEQPVLVAGNACRTAHVPPAAGDASKKVRMVVGKKMAD